MGTRRALAVPAATGILLLGAALRLYGLGAGSLWYDETVSAYLAGLDLPAMLAHTAGDIHPPLYYALLHFWTSVAGSSEFALALFSSVFGLLLIALTQRVASVLAGRTTGWLAALLAAASPFAIWYSQEVRMYTLGSFLALLSTFAMVRILGDRGSKTPEVTTKRRAAWWITYVVSAACGIYSLYYFVFVLAFQNLFALAWLLADRPRTPDGLADDLGPPLLRWASAQSVLFLAFLPWLPVAFRQATQPPVPPWRGSIIPWEALWESWTALAAGQSADPVNLWPFLLLLVGLYLLGLRALAGRPACEVALLPWLLGGYTFIPLALILLISLATPLYHARYVFTYSAAVPIVLAAGLAWLARRGRPALAAGLLLVILPAVISFQDYHTEPAYAADDHRAAVRYLAEHWRPGDAVLVNAGYVYPAVLYYYDGPIAWRGRLTAYPGGPSAPGAVLLQTGSIGGSPQLGWGSPASDFYATTAGETIAALDRAARLHPRIWVYRCYDTVTDPDGTIRRYLDDNYRMLDDAGFAGTSYIRVQLYQARSERPSGSAVTHATEGPDEFAAQVRLLGSDLAGRGRAGEPLYVTLFWQPQRQLADELKAFVTLRDSAGVVAQWDGRPVGARYPTTQWPAGAILRDPWRLDLPVGLPPGEYQLAAGLYRASDGQRLGLLSRDGVLGGQEARLGTVTVDRGAATLSMDSVPSRLDPPVDLGGQVQLAGASIGAESLRPGQTVRVTMWWRALRDLSEDYSVFVQLLDSRDKPWAAADARPWRGQYPTTGWMAGEIVRDWVDLTLAPDAPDGQYRVVAGLYRTADKVRLPRSGLFQSGDSVSLGILKAAGGPRGFDVPAMQRRVNARLGDTIQLLGYDVEPGQSVTLYWQCLGPVGASLKVFFHILNAEGVLIGQHDAVPADGLFPTSGWVKGQVLADRHPLGFDPRTQVPTDYSFLVGMYDPATGQRLPVFDGDGKPLGDSVALPR